MILDKNKEKSELGGIKTLLNQDSEEAFGYKKLSKKEVIEIMNSLKIHFPKISREMQRKIDAKEFK